jgi:hypothetical protein
MLEEGVPTNLSEDLRRLKDELVAVRRKRNVMEMAEGGRVEAPLREQAKRSTRERD